MDSNEDLMRTLLELLAKQTEAINNLAASNMAIVDALMEADDSIESTNYLDGSNVL